MRGKSKISSNDSLQIGGDRTEKTGGQWTSVVGGSVYVKAGATIVIEAGTGITLKVGGNFITIDPSGVAIQGTMVLINSGGAALSGAEKSPGPPDDYAGPAATRYDRSYKL